jgi:hypothetical protein
MRETEHDRHSALALFHEAICLNAGQGLDECALAVIYVADNRKRRIAGH